MPAAPFILRPWRPGGEAPPLLVADGANFADFDGFAHEFSRLLCHYSWHGNLDAFNDISEAGLPPIEPRGLRARISAAQQGRGRTLSDEIVDHGVNRSFDRIAAWSHLRHRYRLVPVGTDDRADSAAAVRPRGHPVLSYPQSMILSYPQPMIPVVTYGDG